MMQWNLNLATHLSFDGRPDIDIGVIIMEVSSRMQDALSSVLHSEDVSVCISFDAQYSQQNRFMGEELRLRCESIEEGVMASIRDTFDL